ncbi:MAG TPA: sigma factor, partial [Usitatibacter sp.]|nr:sigma factor [Usitatibacter sp.]
MPGSRRSRPGFDAGQRARAGPPENGSMAPSTPSYEAIDREFRARLVRHFGRFVDADEARDLAQLTLMKVSGHLPEFRGESSLSTWVYRIATNVALDRLRQRSMDGIAIGGGPEDEEFDGESLPAELRGPSAEDAAMRTEISACVREFVGRLPA